MVKEGAAKAGEMLHIGGQKEEREKEETEKSLTESLKEKAGEYKESMMQHPHTTDTPAGPSHPRPEYTLQREKEHEEGKDFKVCTVCNTGGARARFPFPASLHIPVINT